MIDEEKAKKFLEDVKKVEADPENKLKGSALDEYLSLTMEYLESTNGLRKVEEKNITDEAYNQCIKILNFLLIDGAYKIVLDDVYEDD